MNAKTLSAIVVSSLLIAVVVIVFAGRHGGRRTHEKVPLDVQLKEFERLGIKMNEGATIQDLTNCWPRESLEADPYNSLYSAFGFAQEVPPNLYFCNQIWSFDTEGMIEGMEYDTLLKQIGRISGGELQFGYVSAEYKEDDANPEVTIAFDLNGTRFSWTINPYKDWNSPAFLAELNDFARKQGLKGRLIWNRSWGQDWTLGWHTPEQISALQRLGVDIVEVDPGVTSRPRPKQ